MSAPISGIGPNLTAYQASLAKGPQLHGAHPHGAQANEMQQMARLVSRTLASAFHDVPFPVEAPKTSRERKLLKLRDEVMQMIEELESAVREGGLEEVEWPNTSADHTITRSRRHRSLEEHDDLTLSVRSQQAMMSDPVALAAMQRSLHPLEDRAAADHVAWLAKAQLLHHNILAFHAQANVDREMAQRMLDKPEREAEREAFARRVEHLQHLHEHPPVSAHQSPQSVAVHRAPYEQRAPSTEAPKPRDA